MTDKKKLEKIKALADKMYSRMVYLTSDTRPIRQAMDEYHQFIINEYHKEEPVSEDLEKEIDSYFAKWLQGASDEGCFNPDSQLVSIYDCRRIARHFANWQKQKGANLIFKAKEDGYRLGLATMKRQMMAKAVDAVVKVDAGGYPYVDRVVELYDYEKDIPLAKRGDKYKVILIKE